MVQTRKVTNSLARFCPPSVARSCQRRRWARARGAVESQQAPLPTVRTVLTRIVRGNVISWKPMSDLSLTILPETEADALAIERLHERTFGPGRYARTAYRIREGVSHWLDISFTARIGTLLVGSVRLSPIRIGATPALLLGPLTVEPPFRG